MALNVKIVCLAYLALPRRLQLVRDSNHLPGAFLSLDKDMMILQKYLSSHTVTGKDKKALISTTLL